MGVGGGGGCVGGGGRLSKLAGITSVLGREGRESIGRMGVGCVWGGGGGRGVVRRGAKGALQDS